MDKYMDQGSKSKNKEWSTDPPPKKQVPDPEIDAKLQKQKTTSNKKRDKKEVEKKKDEMKPKTPE